MRNHKVTSNFLILLLALIPNPFFDLAGIAAGSLKIPISQFFIFCAIGEILKILKENGAIYIDENVVVDGKLITANGPIAAEKFGQKILEILTKE